MRRAKVLLVSGDALTATLTAALARWSADDFGGTEAVVMASPGRLARVTAGLLGELIGSRSGGSRVEFLRPAASLQALLPPVAGTAWGAVDLTGRGARLDRVLVPAAAAAAASQIVVAAANGGRFARGGLAIETVASFAHPRQALPVRLDRSRTGLAADVALGFRPSLVVVVAERHPHPLVGLTDDLIAAELLGLAIGERAEEESDTGPWEDPVVQRATELSMGVRLPSAIELVPLWVGDDRDPNADAFGRFHQRLCGRLGMRA